MLLNGEETSIADAISSLFTGSTTAENQAVQSINFEGKTLFDITDIYPNYQSQNFSTRKKMILNDARLKGKLTSVGNWWLAPAGDMPLIRTLASSYDLRVVEHTPGEQPAVQQENTSDDLAPTVESSFWPPPWWAYPVGIGAALFLFRK